MRGWCVRCSMRVDRQPCWAHSWIQPKVDKKGCSSLRSLPTCPLSVTMDLDSIPPITRLWAGSALALALAEYAGLVHSVELFLSFRLVLKGQIWRIPTSLAYFGSFSIDFLFNLIFTTRYARMLEENHYAGHRADFVWLLLFSSAVLVALSPLVALPFLGSPLGFVLVYIWSRRNRHVRLSLFGVLVITAPYLPWALVAFSWMLAGSSKHVVGDLLGIAVGHLCESSVLTSSSHRTRSDQLCPRLLSRRHLAKGGQEWRTKSVGYTADSVSGIVLERNTQC